MLHLIVLAIIFVWSVLCLQTVLLDNTSIKAEGSIWLMNAIKLVQNLVQNECKFSDTGIRTYSERQNSFSLLPLRFSYSCHWNLALNYHRKLLLALVVQLITQYSRLLIFETFFTSFHALLSLFHFCLLPRLMFFPSILSRCRGINYRFSLFFSSFSVSA